MTRRADHPCPFPNTLIPIIAKVLEGRDVDIILDPFAGSGRVHMLADYGFATFGVELEPEWAAWHDRTMVGDSRNLIAAGLEADSVDAIVTSPAYGNRFADTYEAPDDGRRNSYVISLGRQLTAGNGGALHWGPEYRELHTAVYASCYDVVRRGGYFVLNIKSHIANDQLRHVTAWHIRALHRAGFVLWDDPLPVNSGGWTKGSAPSRKQRADTEWLFVFRKMTG